MQRNASESLADYHDRLKAIKDKAQRLMLVGPYRADGGKSSRQQLRDSMRASGRMSKRRRYADVLMAHFDRKALEAKA